MQACMFLVEIIKIDYLSFKCHFQRKSDVNVEERFYAKPKRPKI